MPAIRHCCLFVLLALCLGTLGGCSSTPATIGTTRGLDARLTDYEYPQRVHTRRFRSQRQWLEMAYMDVRAPEPNGRTVLLLHGKNFSGAYWARTIDALTARGYRVIAPDQIGFGKSSKPESFQFGFGELGEHTAGLLDDLGVRRVSVVGHSMGGMLAARFALDHPNRVESLTLVNPIGLEDWARMIPPVTIDDWYARELSATPAGVKKYMFNAYFDGRWKPAYDELLEIQQGWLEGADRERIAWNSALAYDMILSQPVLYGFPDIACPTLLIIGQRDRTALGRDLAEPEVAETMGRYPELGRRTRDAIPDAELVELEGVGHVPQFEAWDAYIAALTAFLERTTNEKS